MLHEDPAQLPTPFATLQTLPHAPQFAGSRVRSVVQPVPAQLPSPGWHEAKPQTPAMQFGVPPAEGQTAPQPPQLFTSEARTASQPFDSIPSQLAYPALHTMPHEEPLHVAVPCCALQVVPHAPQLLGEVLVSVSQPFAAMPSQSANGAMQLLTAHVPFEHDTTACGRLHAVLHAPQWLGSVLRLASHPSAALPSQSPKPDEHAMEHFPPLQLGVPFVPLQAMPHAPQFAALLEVSTSQPFVALPSQSANGFVHEPTVHVPPAHTAFACGGAQVWLQPPQFARSLVVMVSQPSIGLPLQSANPGLHDSVAHAPATHAGVP
jgi:hypothetical protein